MRAIWKRELQNYFMTPIGYVFTGFFLLMGGLFFFFSNIVTGSGSIVGTFSQFDTILMFLAPVLTMRLFSEERKNKSEQLLLTSPLPLPAIVLGKYFAAVSVFILTLSGTSLYVLIVALYGQIFWGELLTAYLGFFLLGCCYIAVGTLVSSMTENQVSAAVAAFGLSFLIWIFDSLIFLIPVPMFSSALEWLSLRKRYSMFLLSQLGISGVVYFLSFCAVLLFLTVRVIDKRRWSEG